MTNRLNERNGYGVIIAAIISTLVIMISGLTSGLVLAVRVRRESGSPNNDSRLMAEYLLEDSAGSLRSSMSALRLCTEAEPAEEIARTALVFAVRAETALECHMEDWADSRDKEAFLNDISTVLHSYTPERTMELADTLYKYSSEFFTAVTDGTVFEYNGELTDTDNDTDNDHDAEVTEDDIAAAQELVANALETDVTEKVGVWDGHIEFYTERAGKTGYAIVCNGKITEFSFTREDNDEVQDETRARQIALETAALCGFEDLSVKWSAVTGKSVSVMLCKHYGDALACDDFATVVVHLDTVVAFTAGGCGHEHKDIPPVEKSETEARKAVKDTQGRKGTLVVRNVKGKERVCYEYRVELEDGVHYVYVCAENGKQMEVK